MDKNQATGLILIFLLLMVYFQFFSGPTPVPPSPVTDPEVTTAPQALPSTETPTLLEHSETPEAQQLLSKYGIYAPAAQGKEQEVVIENDDLLIKISTKGANVKEVMLKKHLTYDKQPLVLIDAGSSKLSWKVPTTQGPVDLSDLFFKTNQTSIILTEGDSTGITFTANIGNGRSIIKTYGFKGTGYQLGANIRFKGFDPGFGNENLVIEWENRIKKLEKDLETS
ncbi:MAG: membrane protein insertase YidC, partial [Bacteroidetes bacterium]|nr:membrane protein insertase YidC [Bacteroidota bacterium]